MTEYRRGARTIYGIKYHLVTVMKYQYHDLKREDGYQARMLIRQTCLGLDVQIEKGQVSKDPVHSLVSVSPTVSPKVKARWARELKQEFARLRERYWGWHFWARGYFCATDFTIDSWITSRFSAGSRIV